MKRLRHGESRARQQKTNKRVPKSDPTGPRVWAPKLSALHMHALAAQAAKKLNTALHFSCEHHLSYLVLSPSQKETLLLRVLGKSQSLYQLFFVSLTSPERIKVLQSKGPHLPSSTTT